MPETPHIPVLSDAVIRSLTFPGLFVDGTFGAGGYTRAILQAHPDNRVIAFDRDPQTAPHAAALAREFPKRLVFVRQPFSSMPAAVREPVRGVVLDLGVSSMQIDTPERGFSFRFDGPLDMRMSQSGTAAQDLVNTLPEKELADMLFAYGEERAARRIAQAIVSARQQEKLTTTGQLAAVIHRVMPRPKDGSDSAQRSFQALRIAVNDELNELRAGLQGAADLLDAGGRLAVVSFHSLEDRIVKEFFRGKAAARVHLNKYAPAAEQGEAYLLLTPKPILPSAEECALNPRAKSAKLRVLCRKGGA